MRRRKRRTRPDCHLQLEWATFMKRDLTIRAVIFDVDGVLVSTDELHYRAWSAIAEAEGIPFDRVINDSLRGVSRMESLEILLQRAKRGYTSDEKQQLADRKNRLFVAAIESLSPEDVAPGALQLISRFRERNLGIAAASSSRNARAILDRLGLSTTFDAILDGNDISRSKPDPEVFHKSATALGVEPGACVVIEDAPAGVEAARRAGMRVIGVGDARVLAEADYVCPSIARLLESHVEIADILEHGR